MTNQTSPHSTHSTSSNPNATSRDQPTIYTDRYFDRLFIRLFSHKMARAVGQRSKLTGYDGFVDLSKQIMQGRNAQGQQQLVAIVLQSLVPRPVLWLIRTLTRPSQLVCELNAWFAARLFGWLVGPCEVKQVIVETAAGPRSQRSGVQIQKCRYLEQSRCVGMCVNMCKLPTQKFFTEEFGIPFTMTPNFEDFSCEMVFGQMPPPLTSEDCYQQPCLDDRRGSAAPSCPKVRA